jgi:hypothetical protein
MESQISLQIILLKPTPTVDFGLQAGSGSNYETVQKQRSCSQDLVFRFTTKIKGDRQKDQAPKLWGPFVQGSSGDKFVYIDIGACAGQADSTWSRRLKIPLTGITWNDVDKLNATPNSILETSVPGTGRDGGPNCATIKPFNGWHFKLCN